MTTKSEKQARGPSASGDVDESATSTSNPTSKSAKARTRARRWKGEKNLEALLVDISTLKNHPDNIDKTHIDVIADSLVRFGQVRPVLVDEDDGCTIIAGHHVVKAARKLGWTYIAVVKAKFKSEAEARAYLMADNETARRGWETLPIEGQTSLVEAIYEQTGSLDGTGWTVDQLRDYQALTMHKTEMMSAKELKLHKRNYRGHPTDQLAHLTRSLKEHGFYRNVVVAKDGTVLAGHGIVLAAREIGLNNIPVTRLDIEPDSPEALKLLAGDNELAKLAEMDDRELAELLKAAHDDVSGLAGTGYDPQTLASLLLVTRRRDEIADVKQAFEWVGLPEFEAVEQPYKLVIQCETRELRDELLEKLKTSGVMGEGEFYNRTPSTHSMSLWYPLRGAYDNLALRFDDDDDGEQMSVYDVLEVMTEFPDDE